MLLVLDFTEVRNNIAGLEDVVESLKHEPETSMEFRLSKMAETSMSQAKDVLSMMAVLG